MIYKIQHETKYHYANEVSISHSLVHLTPRGGPWQTCLTHELRLSVPPAVTAEQTDFFGNPISVFTIQEPHRKLFVTALNVVHVLPPPVPAPSSATAWEHVRDFLRTDRHAASLDAYQFTFASPMIPRDPRFLAYTAPSFPPGRPLLEGLLDLTSRIHADFRFDPTATTIATPLSEVFSLRRGVCQDFAHLEIGCLRALGLAARYVSGYLLTDPPPGQNRLVGADASHAWLSVYSPDACWIDLDPTNNQIPSDKHITLAWGRDYDDVSPIKGVILGGGRHTLQVGVDVAAQPEPERVDLAVGSS
jgi:transglutaminase-like putative cysteine protease